MYVPRVSHAVVGLIGVGVTGFSGYLGSNLVYSCVFSLLVLPPRKPHTDRWILNVEYGTGVQRQGSSLDVKARQETGEELAPQAGSVHGLSGGEYGGARSSK